MDAAARNSIVLIAVAAAGAALFWLREIMTPLVLAIFLMFMIDGLGRWLERRVRLKEDAAVAVALIIIILAFIGSVWLIIDGFQGFANQIRGFGERLNAVIRDVAAMVNIEVAPTAEDLIRQIEPQKYFGTVARGVQAVAFGAFLVLIYLGFLIASRDNMRRKIVALFPERDDRREAVHVFDRVRQGVEGYIWVQTITGLMIAVACFAAMWAVGLENALFWAFVIFLFSYIPIIGGAVAGMGPALFALFQFETYWQAAVLFGVIQIVLFAVANIVQPRMQADDQNIDPVVVLLSLAFWGALWGPAGAFLSTPLTVMAIAIMAEFKSSRWIAILLSSDGEPYPDDEDEDAGETWEPAPPPKPKPRPRKASAVKPM